MAGLVVGGVQCAVEETQVTLGHVVIAVGDIVLFGVANGPSELVIVYERRADETGYREARGAVRTRATTTIALDGEHDLLIAWLRQRVPDRWRGYEETVEHLIHGKPPAQPIPWLRLAAFAVGAVVGAVVFAALLGR